MFSPPVNRNQFSNNQSGSNAGAPFFSAAPKSVVQRQTADERNLTSPRFSGDTFLEKVYDGIEEVDKNRNRRGEHVKKIQQALVDAGFPLPKFGVDGIFGDETESAVKAFQKGTGLNQKEQDGIVGENTLSRLDSRFPTTNAGGTPTVCDTPKKVSVDVIILDKVSRDIQKDFDFMNKVYKPCCIEFVPNPTIKPGAVETFGILGPDGLLDNAECGDISINERALVLSMALRNLSGGIKLVYVNTLNPTNRGLSVPPRCATGARAPLANTAFVEVATEERTPAHEIGHILMNAFADHSVVNSNIMQTTNDNTGSEVAPVQCDIFFART